MPIEFATRGITDRRVLERLQAARLAPPVAQAPMPLPQRGPQYEFYRPWYRRLLAKGCARCGGEPMGWLQRQINTPYRTKRTILWLVNLLPRAASLVRVTTSRRVDSLRYWERQAACDTCPQAVVVLRMHREGVDETSYCGLCDCPKWYGSRNAVRNRCSGWHCPAKRHAGSDPDAVIVAYLRAKAEPRASAEDNGREVSAEGVH